MENNKENKTPVETNKGTPKGEEVPKVRNVLKRDIMAIKKKTDLKDTFCGLNSLYMVKGEIEDLSTIDFTHDMPVLVDSMSYEEGDPTRNPVKIHGLDADWCTMFESGETTFSCSIPTKHPDVLEFFWGKGEKLTSTVNGDSWEGEKYSTSSKQVKVGIGILSGDETKMFIVPEVNVVATNVFESGSTTPHVVRITGSVGSDSFAFLNKKTAEA